MPPHPHSHIATNMSKRRGVAGGVGRGAAYAQAITHLLDTHSGELDMAAVRHRWAWGPPARPPARAAANGSR